MRPVDNANAVKVVQGQSQLRQVELDVLLSKHHLLQQRWNSWTSILKKRLESFLHAIHYLFYWRILKKTILFFGFKNPYKKTAKQEIWSLFINGVRHSTTLSYPTIKTH